MFGFLEKSAQKPFAFFAFFKEWVQKPFAFFAFLKEWVVNTFWFLWFLWIKRTIQQVQPRGDGREMDNFSLRSMYL